MLDWQFFLALAGFLVVWSIRLTSRLPDRSLTRFVYALLPMLVVEAVTVILLHQVLYPFSKGDYVIIAGVTIVISFLVSQFFLEATKQH